MEEIKWIGTPSSSNIERIGYDREAQVFYVEFKKTGTYQYAGFPEDKWNAALDAPSIGKFVASEVKDKFVAKKI